MADTQVHKNEIYVFDAAVPDVLTPGVNAAEVMWFDDQPAPGAGRYPAGSQPPQRTAAKS